MRCSVLYRLLVTQIESCIMILVMLRSFHTLLKDEIVEYSEEELGKSIIPETNLLMVIVS